MGIHIAIGGESPVFRHSLFWSIVEVSECQEENQLEFVKVKVFRCHLKFLDFLAARGIMMNFSNRWPKLIGDFFKGRRSAGSMVGKPKNKSHYRSQ